MLKLNIVDMKDPGSYESGGDVRAQRRHAYQAEMLQREASSARGLLLLPVTTKIILVDWSLLEPLPLPCLSLLKSVLSSAITKVPTSHTPATN